MLYTFFYRALIVLVGMVVVGFASYYLLTEFIYTKNEHPTMKESYSEISVVEGVVKSIHTTPTTTTPARIEVMTGEGVVKSVLLQSMAQCVTSDVYDISKLSVGDVIAVKGSTSKRGDVLPCDDVAHYVRLVEKVGLDLGQATVHSSTEVSNSIVFSGTLESYEAACLYDGECFVVIDGRKVTVRVGRSSEPVGELLDINLSTLQEYIGKRFEVYALSIGDDAYTLYGNSDFYLRPL